MPIDNNRPTPSLITNPVGIDRACQAIQKHLATDGVLDWLQYSFGRAHLEYEHGSLVPMLWSQDRADLYNALANDSWASYSFMYTKGEYDAKGVAFGLDERLEVELNIIFYVNYRLAKPNVKDSVPEQLMINEALAAIQGMYGESTLLTLQAVHTQTALDDFGLSAFKKGKRLKYPYAAFRFQYTAKYYQKCRNT